MRKQLHDASSSSSLISVLKFRATLRRRHASWWSPVPIAATPPSWSTTRSRSCCISAKIEADVAVGFFENFALMLMLQIKWNKCRHRHRHRRCRDRACLLYDIVYYTIPNLSSPHSTLHSPLASTLGSTRCGFGLSACRWRRPSSCRTQRVPKRVCWPYN